MANYEYRVIEVRTEGGSEIATRMQKQLNELGLQGWKVVGTGGSGAGSSYGFDQNGWVILMREV